MRRISTAPPTRPAEGRRRLQRPGLVRAAIAAALLAASSAIAMGAPAALAAPDTATTCALRYLAAQQGADGLLGSPGVTEDFIFGASAAGFDPTRLAPSGGASAYDYLSAHAAGVVGDAGASGKLTLVVVVGHKDPAAFGGQDLLADVDATFDSGTGKFGDGETFSQSLAILALVAANDSGHPVPAAAVAHLKAVQDTDGSWDFQGVKDASGGGDTNSTALAIQALAAAGVSKSDASITAALAYLGAQQLSDGGFPFTDAFGPPSSDPDSDAIVIQGLIAAGQDPAAAKWTKGGTDARENMLTFRDPKTGGFTFPGNPGPDAFTTSQVPAGLAGVPLPGSTTWTAGSTLPAGTCAAASTASPSFRPSPSGTRVRPTRTPSVTPPTTSSTDGAPVGDAPLGPVILILGIFGAGLLAVTRSWARRPSR